MFFTTSFVLKSISEYEISIPSDLEIFTDGKNLDKKYDIVMVGNWGKAKRHYLLFQAVKKMKIKPRIALIGYPLKNRSIQDVMYEAKLNQVFELCEFFENKT